jgi:hypothetical protein
LHYGDPAPCPGDPSQLGFSDNVGQKRTFIGWMQPGEVFELSDLYFCAPGGGNMQAYLEVQGYGEWDVSWQCTDSFGDPCGAPAFSIIKHGGSKQDWKACEPDAEGPVSIRVENLNRKEAAVYIAVGASLETNTTYCPAP